MEYSISFDTGSSNDLIANFASFEMAMIAAKQFSKIFTGQRIVLRSMFFTYIYVNGVEL
jgi:hypothetical protein